MDRCRSSLSMKNEHCCDVMNNYGCSAVRVLKFRRWIIERLIILVIEVLYFVLLLKGPVPWFANSSFWPYSNFSLGRGLGILIPLEYPDFCQEYQLNFWFLLNKYPPISGYLHFALASKYPEGAARRIFTCQSKVEISGNGGILYCKYRLSNILKSEHSLNPILPIYSGSHEPIR